MKKTLMIMLPVLAIANVEQVELINAIKASNEKKVKELINSKSVNINETNRNCETPLDAAFEKFEKSDVAKIGESLSIISMLQRNGAKRNITPADFERCFLVKKEKYKLSKIKEEKISDYDLLKKQLNNSLTTDLVKKEKLVNQFYTTMKPIISEFNASLFVADGNYLDIKQDGGAIYSNHYIDIADWKEKKTNHKIEITPKKLELALSINVKEFATNLDNLFKNRDFLNQIQIEKNKLTREMNQTENELKRKDLKERIKRYEKSFAYIVDKSITEIKKFKKVINN